MRRRRLGETTLPEISRRRGLPAPVSAVTGPRSAFVRQGDDHIPENVGLQPVALRPTLSEGLLWCGADRCARRLESHRLMFPPARSTLGPAGADAGGAHEWRPETEREHHRRRQRPRRILVRDLYGAAQCLAAADALHARPPELGVPRPRRPPRAHRQSLAPDSGAVVLPCAECRLYQGLCSIDLVAARIMQCTRIFMQGVSHSASELQFWTRVFRLRRARWE